MPDGYDYKYDCLQDPYVYSGTTILKNKFNIKNQEELSLLERRITETKILTQNNVRSELPKGNFDLKHLQAIHKFLFSEIYEWAGEIRTAGFIIKGQSIFCFAPRIEPYANTIFTKMNCENFSQMDTQQCAEKMAYYLSEINALHPFREGNGRATRLFFELFAYKHGWQLSLFKMPHDLLTEAMIESMNGSLTSLSKLLKNHLKRKDENEQQTFIITFRRFE